MTGPAQDFSWAGPLRPKIFAGRAGQSGPKIYNPVSDLNFEKKNRLTFFSDEKSQKNRKMRFCHSRFKENHKIQKYKQTEK